MSRIMGDTTHLNVRLLAGHNTLQLVAGYDTGTSDVQWTANDWALFPGIPHVHIDQGFGDMPSHDAHVMVFDFEPGAFHPSQADYLIDRNTSSRPTLYVNRLNINATVISARKSPNWKGDIWLAFPGWQNGDSLPPIPRDCRYVAIQNSFTGPYDLSEVLDDSWPNLPMPIRDWPSELPIVSANFLGIGAIRRVQALCVAVHLPIAIDGVYGPQTINAVKTIQRAEGIPADGVVGPQTWPVLLGV